MQAARPKIGVVGYPQGMGPFEYLLGFGEKAPSIRWPIPMQLLDCPYICQYDCGSWIIPVTIVPRF